MDSFDLGIVDGMQKTALSPELVARAATKRGVHPNMLRALVGAKRRTGGLSVPGNIEKSIKRLADQGMFSRADVGSKDGARKQVANYLKSWARG